MTDRIEPALSSEEWAHAMDEDVREGLAYEVTYLWGSSRPAATIALANAALLDSDPRKITRTKITLLREAADSHRAYDSIEPFHAEAKSLAEFANALESYLPPE